MDTGNVLDRPNISVSIGLENVMDRYGTDQKAIRYNGQIVLLWQVIQDFTVNCGGEKFSEHYSNLNNKI